MRGSAALDEIEQCAAQPLHEIRLVRHGHDAEPARLRSRETVSMTSVAFGGSRAEVGSSSNRASGFRRMARAMVTRCSRRRTA